MKDTLAHFERVAETAALMRIALFNQIPNIPPALAGFAELSSTGSMSLNYVWLCLCVYEKLMLWRSFCSR